MELSVLELALEALSTCALQESVASHHSLDDLTFVIVPVRKTYLSLAVRMVANKVALKDVTVYLCEYSHAFPGVQVEIAFVFSICLLGSNLCVSKCPRTMHLTFVEFTLIKATIRPLFNAYSSNLTVFEFTSIFGAIS